MKKLFLLGLICLSLTITLSGQSNLGLQSIDVQEGGSTSSPLPIDLVSFDASQKNKQVELNWETASETNNDFFTVERSMDGRLFAQIGHIAGAGSSEFSQKYSFIDKNPKRGTNYYRLSQTDFDGHTETFDVTTVNVVVGQTSINPTNVKDVMILNFEPSRSTGLVSIFNLAGQQVYDAEIEPETTTLEINASVFAQGQYFARFSFGGEIQTVRFLKY